MARRTISWGGHPLWQLCRGIFQMGKKPYVLGGLSLLYGYFSCWMACKEKPISKELMDFHRLFLNFMLVDR